MFLAKKNLKRISWLGLALVIGTLASSHSAQAQEPLYLGAVDALTAIRLQGDVGIVAGDVYPLEIRLNESPADVRFPYLYVLTLEDTIASLRTLHGEAGFASDGKLVVNTCYYMQLSQSATDLMLSRVTGAFVIDIDFLGQDTSQLVATAPQQTVEFSKRDEATLESYLFNTVVVDDNRQYAAYLGYDPSAVEGTRIDFFAVLRFATIQGTGTLGRNGTIEVAAGDSFVWDYSISEITEPIVVPLLSAYTVRTTGLIDSSTEGGIDGGKGGGKGGPKK